MPGHPEIFLREVEPIENESDMCGMRKTAVRTSRGKGAALTVGLCPLRRKDGI